MTDTQLDLFAGPGVRNSDPVRSRAAAESMPPEALNRQSREVLQCVAWFADGITAYEVHEAIGIQQNVASTRLSGLRKKGYVRDTGIGRPGSSGRLCGVYKITDEGRAVL